MNTQTKEKSSDKVAGAAENVGYMEKPQEHAQISVFKEQLQKMNSQIAPVLPPEIDPARFVRIVLTAVQKNPDLLAADRNSLFQSAIEAAADGLLPDNREGAFVIFSTKVKWNGVEQWIKKVQWMPMITGITKKVLATGQVKEFRARVVYEKDLFEVILGDDDQIIHKPHLSRDRGEIIAAYAVLKKHDGGVEREIMIKEDLDEVRAASKTAEKGPWKGWYSEMARKTVSRRLLKRCAFDEDVQSMLERSDETNYALNKPHETPRLPKKAAAAVLDDFSGQSDDAGVIDMEVDGSPASTEQQPEEGAMSDCDAYVQAALAKIRDADDRNELDAWWLDEIDERKRLDLSDDSTKGTILINAMKARLDELAPVEEPEFPGDRK